MAYEPYVGGGAGRALRDVPLYGPKGNAVRGGMSARMKQALDMKRKFAQAQWAKMQEREAYERKWREDERSWNREREQR